MQEQVTIQQLLDLEHTIAAVQFATLTYPWEALPQISGWIIELGKTLSSEEYEQRGENVWIAKSATVYPSAYIVGPAIIGPNTEVRHGAFYPWKCFGWCELCGRKLCGVKECGSV